MHLMCAYRALFARRYAVEAPSGSGFGWLISGRHRAVLGAHREGAAVTFREVLAALRVRWWIAGAAMVIALAAGWLVVHPKPVYQATAVVVLVPPTGSSQNALASVTPSIAAAGLAVDDILLSQGEVSALRGSGVTDQFTITPRNNGTDETPAYTVPSEQITVTGGDEPAGLREAETLVQAYTDNLRSMQSQAGIAAKAQITAGLLAAPSSVELQGSRSRGMLAAGLLGLIAAVALAVRLRPGRSVDQRARGQAVPPAGFNRQSGTGAEERDEAVV